MATTPSGGGSASAPWYGYPISQGFKWTPSQTHAHSGIDIRDPQGTPITAPQSGTIVSQGMEPWGGQVNELVQTPSGPEMLSFLHLSQLSPTTGHVEAGARIGSSGTPPPGYGNGAHLHFEMSSGSAAPYMSSYNPWYPTAQSHPLNPTAYIAGLNIAGIGSGGAGAAGGGSSSGGSGGGSCNWPGYYWCIATQGGQGAAACAAQNAACVQDAANGPIGDVGAAVATFQAGLADGVKRAAVFLMAGLLTLLGLYLMLKPQVDGAVHDAIRGAEVAAV